MQSCETVSYVAELSNDGRKSVKLGENIWFTDTPERDAESGPLTCAAPCTRTQATSEY